MLKRNLILQSTHSDTDGEWTTSLYECQLPYCRRSCYMVVKTYERGQWEVYRHAQDAYTLADAYHQFRKFRGDFWRV